MKIKIAEFYGQELFIETDILQEERYWSKLFKDYLQSIKDNAVSEFKDTMFFEELNVKTKENCINYFLAGNLFGSIITLIVILMNN